MPVPEDRADVGEQRTRQLVGVLIASLVAIVCLSVAVRMVIEPEQMKVQLPIALASIASLMGVFALNLTRFHRLAAFLFCLDPVWLNLVEGLERPEGPVWYGLIPLAAILGGTLLRFREALVLALLGLASAVVVVLARPEAISTDRGTLIVMYVALINAAALGMSAFRARVERERRADLDRLSAQLAATERLESIGRLAGGVAHDFNNLLTVMLTSAEAARSGQLEALDDVVDAGERAAVLTRQLLAFSRHGGGERVSVAVDQVIGSVRTLLRRLLPENITLELQLSAGATVQLEEQQLEQVVFNLAANARDAMPSGGTLTIRTGVEVSASAGAEVVVEVADTGVGMDERTRAHVFEPFFTTKQVGKGTGLGLATVYGIVQRASGRVDLVSAPGQGTRVTVRLPRVAERQASAAPPIDDSTPLEGLVLLVEDEALVRKATARLLEELGLEVLTASSPAAVPAVLAQARAPIALLISDVVMPGGSGLELVEGLRAERPELPVVMISGYAHEDLQGLLKTKATRFLAKPFTRASLGAVIRGLLRAAR